MPGMRKSLPLGYPGQFVACDRKFRRATLLICHEKECRDDALLLRQVSNLPDSRDRVLDQHATSPVSWTRNAYFTSKSSALSGTVVSTFRPRRRV